MSRGRLMFEQAFKSIDDVLRKEAGCTTELDYTEQTEPACALIERIANHLIQRSRQRRPRRAFGCLIDSLDALLARDKWAGNKVAGVVTSVPKRARKPT